MTSKTSMQSKMTLEEKSQHTMMSKFQINDNSKISSCAALFKLNKCFMTSCHRSKLKFPFVAAFFQIPRSSKCQQAFIFFSQKVSHLFYDRCELFLTQKSSFFVEPKSIGDRYFRSRPRFPTGISRQFFLLYWSLFSIFLSCRKRQKTRSLIKWPLAFL